MAPFNPMVTRREMSPDKRDTLQVGSSEAEIRLRGDQ
jgi:hypothetical protein